MNTLVLDKVSNNGHSDTQALTASALPNQKSAPPDPQVIQKPARRRFSNADKLRILKQADACHKPGELGALLRKEGLYSSTLSNFRKQREQGKLQDSDPQKKAAQRKSNEAARHRDTRKLAQMQKEIQQLHGLLELQKKLSDLLGIQLDSLTTNSE